MKVGARWPSIELYPTVLLFSAAFIFSSNCCLFKLSFPLRGVTRGFLAFSTPGLNTTSKATLLLEQFSTLLQKEYRNSVLRRRNTEMFKVLKALSKTFPITQQPLWTDFSLPWHSIGDAIFELYTVNKFCAKSCSYTDNFTLNESPVFCIWWVERKIIVVLKPTSFSSTLKTQFNSATDDGFWSRVSNSPLLTWSCGRDVIGEYVSRKALISTCYSLFGALQVKYRLKGLIDEEDVAK